MKWLQRRRLRKELKRYPKRQHDDHVDAFRFARRHLPNIPRWWQFWKWLGKIRWWQMNRRRKKRFHKTDELFPPDRITPLQKLFESGKLRVQPNLEQEYRCFWR